MGRVFVCSGASITDELRERYRIGELPLTVNLASGGGPEGKITAVQVVEDQRRGRKPTTAAPTPEYVKGILSEAILKGDKEIIVITLLARAPSLTFDNISQVAKELMEEHEGVRIEVVDSFSVSMTEGFLALKVAEILEQGASLDYAVDVARHDRWGSVLLVALATPKFAGGGGRVKTLVTRAGALIGICPTVVVLPNSPATTFGRLGGMHRTMKKAESCIVEKAMGLWQSGARIGVVYAPDEEAEKRAKELVQTLSTQQGIPEEEIPLVAANATLLVHAGPGAVGIALLLPEPAQWDAAHRVGFNPREQS